MTEPITPPEASLPPIETFYQATDRWVTNGNRVMTIHHDSGGIDPKEYHTSLHPQALQRRAELLANVFELSPEERQILKAAISWHDTTINYNPAPSDITGRITRHRGALDGDTPSGVNGNEAQSIRDMTESAQAINKEARQTLITDNQIKTAADAIVVTYPGVDLGTDWQGAMFKDYAHYNSDIIAQNPKIKIIIDDLAERGIIKSPHFFQPHLELMLERGEEVPIEVLITALVDLGAAGMGEKEEFFKEGNAEFRELFENIRKPGVLTQLITEETGENRGKTAKEMLDWLRGQVGFATWQMLRFEKIIFLLKKNGQLNTQKEEALRKSFSHFEDNIQGAFNRFDQQSVAYQEKVQQQEEKPAFVALVKNIGYPVDSLAA